METLIFLLVLIIGLLSGITGVCLYILKRFLDNNFIELPRLKK